jgi:predicted kinase
VHLQGLFLEADVATRAQRASTRARDASDANAAVVRAQETYDLGALAWHRIDASGTPETTLQRASVALG